MSPRRLIAPVLVAAAASAFQLWVISQTVMWETTKGKVEAVALVLPTTLLLTYLFVYRRSD